MRAFLAFIFSLLATCVYAETKLNDSPVDNKSTYHLTDSIDLIAKSDVRYDKPRVVIRLSYPYLAENIAADISPMMKDDPAIKENGVDPVASSGSLAMTFNEEATKMINEEIRFFKDKVAQAGVAAKPSKTRNRLTIDYSSAIVNLEKQPIISVRFIIQGYVNGTKEAYKHYRSLNFDMQNGTTLQLADLFKSDAPYMTIITDYTETELGKGKFATRATLTPEQFSNWNININGLRITFDNEPASKSILIPYAKLQRVINPESALGKCLEHRKRCMQDHLLTGGFIDEAANTRHRRLNPILG